MDQKTASLKPFPYLDVWISIERKKNQSKKAVVCGPRLNDQKKMNLAKFNRALS